jgi:hypothetical protein
MDGPLSLVTTISQTKLIFFGVHNKRAQFYLFEIQSSFIFAFKLRSLEKFSLESVRIFRFFFQNVNHCGNVKPLITL